MNDFCLDHRQCLEASAANLFQNFCRDPLGGTDRMLVPSRGLYTPRSMPPVKKKKKTCQGKLTLSTK